MYEHVYFDTPKNTLKPFLTAFKEMVVPLLDLFVNSM